MQKIFLIPPSEGKNPDNKFEDKELSFTFKKPYDIAINASEKDLKCKGKRYDEAIKLNSTLVNSPTNHAINRYTGVMYKAIDYQSMSLKAKTYFEENFLILSGMYGVIKPLDKIGNYKLPIETKGLYNFWDKQIAKALI